MAAPIIRHELYFRTLWLQLLWIPQFIATLGGAWLIAALGVFLRDMTQGISLFLMSWMYLTPIIYPESILGARHRFYIGLNPFTPLIWSYRRILIEGVAADWPGLVYFAAFAAAIFVFGYWWFAKTRRNFSDVI